MRIFVLVLYTLAFIAVDGLLLVVCSALLESDERQFVMEGFGLSIVCCLVNIVGGMAQLKLMGWAFGRENLL